MYDRSNILSERLDDNRAAVEWSLKMQERCKKGERIAKEIMAQITPIILANRSHG